MALFLACLGAASAQEGRAALVTALRGPAQAVRQGQPLALRTVMLLDAGEEVRVPAGSTVTLIFLRDSHSETVQGPCRVRVEAAGSRLVEGKPAQVRRGKPVAAPLVPRGRNLDRMAGLVLHHEMFDPASPRSTTARTWTGPPTFTWVGGRGPFTVRVSHEDGTVVWEATTGERTLRYGGPPLEEDRNLFLEIASPEVEAPGYGLFRLLSGRTREQVRQAEEAARRSLKADPRDATPYVLLMGLYNDNEMLDEAIRVGRQAVQAHPRDGGLHLALSKLLRLAGRSDEAEAEAERARKLGASDF